MSKPTIRCAIYTRKSTEEGLDQDFNSLDAQREACAAYVLSQASLGWKEISQHYDDGGISGGTMDRPALQDLLQDIKAGKVEVVVVYKIDRLTRSLMDFAKIVEVFDAQKVSFVSITQQFNTLSSMGRLTLNVLLSFAQFEREVTAERIRDKIAASKRKGMWMGGAVPLGYSTRDKKLLVNPVEAETVRMIFRLYREIGSVRKLKEHLDRLGTMTKPRLRKNGYWSGGKPFTRGHLYWLLSNPIYAGLIRHKDRIAKGQHEAIIDHETWETTQASLTGKAPFQRAPAAAKVRGGGTRVLAGLLYDETGDRLSPSHANKNGVRYRYYISQRLMQAGRKDSSAWRVPTKVVEDIVIAELANLLADTDKLQMIIKAERLAITELETLTAKAKSLRDTLINVSAHRIKEVIRSIVVRITIEPGRLTLAIDRKKLATALAILSADASTEPCLLTLPFTLKRKGVEAKLILGNNQPQLASIDPILLEAISQAHLWLKQLTTGAAKSVVEIAAITGVDDGEVSRVLPLAFLAPDIVRAVLDGRQPATLTARYLKRLKPIPNAWSDQRRILGFEPAHSR